MGTEYRKRENPLSRKICRIGYAVLVTVLCLAGATVMGMFFHYMRFPDTNVVLMYILSVFIIARLVPGYVCGIAASAAATLTFNYFFTAPYLTLNVYDSSYLITFVVMTVTALVTSALTTRAKKESQKAKEKEQISNTLYQLTHRLTEAGDLEGIAGVIVSEAARVLECDVACLCFERDGSPCDTYAEMSGDGLTIRRTGEGEKERFFEMFAGETSAGADKPEDTAKASGTSGAAYLEKPQGEKQYKQKIVHTAEAVCREEVMRGDERFCDFPIHGKERTLGILRITAAARPASGSAYYSLLIAMLENTALAIERYFNMQESTRSREEAAKERDRGNLLRSMSHDLRTPLAGIMGNSEILMKTLKKEGAEYGLASGIYKDADWLLSLVENILNLTRLQDGRMVLHRAPEVLEEIVGSAVAHITKRYPEREISVEIPDEFLMISVDGRLMEQVLVNLLDNAVKHTPPEKEIALLAKKSADGKHMVFQVRDEGSGIKSADLPHIFELFYTTGTKRADARRGVGLGLAICETIVKMHGGTILAGNRTDKTGAEIIFELPLEEKDGEQ